MLRKREKIMASGTSPCRTLTGVYTIDPVHSTIGFSVRHAMIMDMRGRFTAFEGLLKIDGSHPARSEAYMSVQTGSLDTGSRERDAHTTGPDFLDSATFPLMTFCSTGIVHVGKSRFGMRGELRIKDIELPIRIDLEFGGATEDTYGQSRVGFEGTATLQRADWGLNWNATLATGGVLISDHVNLILDISAVRLRPANAA
ncbi:YceI family protein [Streptomyces sp. NPDC002285]